MSTHEHHTVHGTVNTQHLNEKILSIVFFLPPHLLPVHFLFTAYLPSVLPLTSETLVVADCTVGRGLTRSATGHSADSHTQGVLRGCGAAG